MSIVPLEEDDTLRQIFTQLDVNGDGQLNLQELTEGLQHAGLSRRTQSLFNVLDVDNQGSVNWNQFQKVGSGFLSVLQQGGEEDSSEDDVDEYDDDDDEDEEEDVVVVNDINLNVTPTKVLSKKGSTTSTVEYIQEMQKGKDSFQKKSRRTKSMHTVLANASQPQPFMNQGTTKTESSRSSKVRVAQESIAQGKYLKSERERASRIWKSTCRLTFLFLLPFSNLFHCLCHVSPLF